MQNKKIKNVAPTYGNQAHARNIKKNVIQECTYLKEEILQLKRSQNKIFKVLTQPPLNSIALIYHSKIE